MATKAFQNCRFDSPGFHQEAMKVPDPRGKKHYLSLHIDTMLGQNHLEKAIAQG
jgi:hypothetical protein